MDSTQSERRSAIRSDTWILRVGFAIRFLRWYDEREEVPMVELSEPQRQALAVAGETPVPVIDPDTRTAYVLLAAEDSEILGWEGDGYRGVLLIIA
jgi:hypothetical protein